MDTSTVVSVVSMAIAIGAFVVAVLQVNMQASVEARRKGKIDKLAIGDWAVTWPLAKLVLYFLSRPIPFLRDRFADPRVLKVPFITTGAIWDYLLHEARDEHRGPLDRRMSGRLVNNTSEALGEGRGQYTGRMYAVRSTTRKTSEACWADALRMCDMTPKHWSALLMTDVSAPGCDGAIRPANTITNLHSLLGFARIMGLRRIEKEAGGKRWTMTNGGTWISTDLDKADSGHPIRLAHFSGSPNGRYYVIEEMSQQTAESVYADAMWSFGCIPSASKLTPGKVISDGRGKYRDQSEPELHVQWPQDCVFPLDRDFNDPEFASWACAFTDAAPIEGEPAYDEAAARGVLPLMSLIKSQNRSMISCIRTFPKETLSEDVRTCACLALKWCVEHWRMDPFQALHAAKDQQPRVPCPSTARIGCEFITDIHQARIWCRDTLRSNNNHAVSPRCWDRIVSFSTTPGQPEGEDDKNSGKGLTPSHLGIAEEVVLTKILQAWKLRSIIDLAEKSAGKETFALLAFLVMVLEIAQLAVAANSSEMGDSEENKGIEIEFG